MTWLAGWNKRIKFSIDPTKVSETLYDMPVLIKLDSTYEAVFTELGSNSTRLLFRSDLFEAQLYCEVSHWDTVNKLATLWVRLPVISSTYITSFYMFYDNTQNNNTSYISTTGAAYWEESSNYISGVLVSDAVVVSNYIRLNTATNSIGGKYTLNTFKIQPEFTVKFDHWAGGGSGADWTRFVWGQSPINEFVVEIDEYHDTIELQVNGTTLQTTSMTTIDNSTWREIIIQTTLVDNNINVVMTFGGGETQYINVNVPYVKNSYPGIYWMAATGGSNNEHRIRNLRVYNKNLGSGGVWDKNFIAVYHMNQDLGSALLVDSTSRACYGTPLGSMSTTNLVNSEVDKAISFDGLTNYISISNYCSCNISLTKCFTFSCRIKKNSMPTVKQYIWTISGPSSGNDRVLFGFNASSNVLNLQVYNNAGQGLANISGTTNVCDGAFYEVTAVYEKDTKFAAIYINGVLDASIYAAVAWPWALEPTARMSIGQRFNSSTPIDFFSGVIDEVFISSTCLTAPKILAIHKIKTNSLVTYYIPEVISTGILPYANKITLTIPYGNIANNLYNFPVLVNLTSAGGFNKQDLTKVFNVLSGPENRKKIAITDATGIALCSVEIEKWEHANKTAQLWVRVPVVSSTINTILYLYYDATADDNIFINDSLSINSTDVWSSNFYSVYHTNQNPQPYVYDATINKLDLPSKGNMNNSNVVETSTGNVYYFDGTSNTVGRNYATPHAPINTFSFECVCKAITTHEIDTQSNSGVSGSSGQKYVFLTAQDASDTNLATAGLSVGTNGVSVYEWTASYLPATAVYSATLTDYMHICIVYINKTANIYVNGDKVVTGVASAKGTVRCPNDFGGNPSYGYFNGYLSKIRISDVALSAAWIKATYLSNFDNLIIYDLNTVPTVNWLSTYENGVLTPWAKRIKLEVDYTKTTTPLTNFPMLISVSNNSGISNIDLTEFFNNLNHTITDYNFPETQYNIPNPKIWSGTGTYVNNNKLVFTATKYVQSLFSFKGNCDIQINFDISASPNIDSHALGIDLCQLDSAKVYKLSIRRESDDIYYYSVHRYEASTWTRDYFVSTSDRSGKLRIQIVGSNIYFYKWDGSAWTSLYNRTHLFNNYYYVRPLTETWDTNPILYSTLSNFIINSGNVEWLSGNHPNKYKIAITTDNGTTQLPIEIESWDQLNKSLQLWVKVPLITTDKNTKLYLYYDITKSDNTEYVSSIGYKSISIWSNFLGVYHLSQNPMLSILDSTSNYYNLTSYGSMGDTALVNTDTGKTLSFDGVNDYLSNSSLRFSTNITILCRFYLNTLASSSTICHQGNATQNPNQGTAMSIGTDGKVSVGYYSTGAWRSITSQSSCYIGDNIVSAIIDSTNLVYTFYINAVKETGVLPAVLTTSTYPFYIGVNNTTSLLYFFNGKIRELRIMNTVDNMSLAHFKVINEYFNDNLITYNAVELYTPPVPPTSTYTYHGYVKEKNVPITRTVNLYNRASGLLIDSTITNTEGYYLMQAHTNDEHFIVVLDDESNYKYAPLVKDRLLPNN